MKCDNREKIHKLQYKGHWRWVDLMDQTKAIIVHWQEAWANGARDNRDEAEKMVLSYKAMLTEIEKAYDQWSHLMSQTITLTGCDGTCS